MFKIVFVFYLITSSCKYKLKEPNLGKPNQGECLLIIKYFSVIPYQIYCFL
jgi:hypothetical protein